MTLNRRWRFDGRKPTKPGDVGSCKDPPLLYVEVMAESDWSGRSELFRQRSTCQNHCAEVLNRVHFENHGCLGPRSGNAPVRGASGPKCQTTVSKVDTA